MKKNNNLIIQPPRGYTDWLVELKIKIHNAQQRATLAVNNELVLLYWQIGNEILTRQEKQGWGAKVIERLAGDLRNFFPDIRGFSRTNLLYMRSFAECWSDEKIVQQLVGQLPWGHNLVLLDKLKNSEDRIWYAKKAIENNWCIEDIERELAGGGEAMNERSFLEKLLDGEEVEWKRLSEVTQYEQPTKYLVETKNYSDKFKIPVLTAGKTFVLGHTDETTGVYEASKNPVIIFDDFTTANKWVDFDFKAKSSAMKMITSSDESRFILKYIYYWLNTLPSDIIDGDHQRQWISNYCNKEIPIPAPKNPKKSLEIQAEIVRILDNFTELIAELIAELTARKKQYNYYREQLFCFDSLVEHLPMGHERAGLFIRGGVLQKKDFTETGVGCIHYGQIYTYYGTYADKTKTFVSEEFAKKSRKARSGDLIIATTSENDEDVCKAVAWLGSEDIAVSSDACIYRHSLNPKYISYFFQTEQFQKQKRSYITGAKVRRVNADDLRKLLIPIPSLEEQARIVAILDKFDVLTSSITEGLPREIELRQKQYEYYRDLLINFPKPAEVKA